MAKLSELEKVLAGPGVSSQVSAQNQFDTLGDTTAFDRAGAYGYLGSIEDSEVDRLGFDAAKAFLLPQLESGEKTKEDLYALAEQKIADIQTVRRQQFSKGSAALAKAGTKGAFLTPNSAMYTKEQEQLMALKMPWKKTSWQVHQDMIKDSDVSTEDFARFSSTHPDKVMEDPSIPASVKEMFKGRMDQEYVGPESFDDPSPEGRGWFAETSVQAGMGVLKGLVTLSEFSNGFIANYHEALGESDLARELEKKGGSTVAGVPSELLAVPFMSPSFAKNVISDPGMAGRILMEQLAAGLDSFEEGAKTSMGVWTDMGPTKGIAKTLARTRVAYEKEAFDLAKEELGATQSTDAFNAKQSAIFAKLVENDAAELAMQWPRTTEAVVSGLTDPLNLIGGSLFKVAAKTIQGTWNVGKVIPGLKQILGGTEDAAKFFAAPARLLLTKGPYDSMKNIDEGSRILKSMGDHGEAMRRAMMAAQDAGQASRRELVGVYGSIDQTLSRLGKDDVAPFYDIIEEWGASGRSAAALDIEVAKHFPDPKKQLRIKVLAREYIDDADKFFEISAKNGQLNDVRKIKNTVNGEAVVGHAVTQASKVEGFVPRRHFEGIGDITKKVNAAGFVDVDSAILALKKNKASEKLLTLDPASAEYKATEELVNQFDELLVARGGNKADLTDLLSDKNKDLRSVLYKLDKAGSQYDVMGQSRLHRVSGATSTAKERVGGLNPIKDAKLQWKTHIAREAAKGAKSAEIKELAAFAGIKEVASTFRGESLHQALSSGGMIKVLELSKEGTKKLKHDENVIAAAVQRYGDELGMEYTMLDRKFSEKILQISGTKFDPTKSIVAVPKAIGMRLEEVLPRFLPDGGDKYGKIASVYDDFTREFLKPVNDLFRPSRTVNRSLAFHTVNYAGAVGIGILAHGARALNPGLQREAVMLAYKNSFADLLGTAAPTVLGTAIGAGVGYDQTGDWQGAAMGGAAGMVGGKSLQMLARTNVGNKFKAENLMVKVGRGANDKIRMSDAQEIMQKYGLTGQGALRYGGEARGIAPGPSSWNLPGRAIAKAADAQRTFATKSRLQQVAQMGDDYQKIVTFLGFMRQNGKVVNGKLSLDSIHRGIDFTSEYAGNYSRLTQFEKRFMRDTFAFYSWNRFILPVLAKQMWRNPQRLAGFDKIRRGMEGYVYDTTGGAVPTAGVPDWLRLSGATLAPQQFQVQDGSSNELPHYKVMGIMETPSVGISAFAPGFSGESPMTAQYGPIGLSLAYAIGGFNEGVLPAGRGGRIKGWLPSLDEVSHAFDSPEELSAALFAGDDSMFFREAKNAVPLGSALMDLSKLYLRHGMIDEAAEVPLRFRSGRDFMGLDNVMARSMGVKPLSIANWVPGYRMYPIDPLRVAARRKARARSSLPDKPFD